MAQRIEDVSHLDWRELKDVLEAADRTAVVIDVREPEEYEEAHIEGLPLIPMGDIIDWTETLDPEREYIFVCRSGRRSFEVAKYFQNNGFGHVHNFQGGMLSWIGEGNDVAKGSAAPIESFELPLTKKGDNEL
ncbi:rhodanese-like domain-containing protein [Paenibacillus koleovorans]|uniref:rhodanese-like domain-containing protein n=1 Tax=Paenibacillus koleovorans TaxID=121608 RepID=UPI000FD997C9|nr:rhodanese-like domain-containing protein [Paenibacillus koleovorans]